MAVDVFHSQIESMGMVVAGIVLKLGVMSSSGALVWAQLHPDKWVDVIRDGDEIRIEGSGASSNSHVPGNIVTFTNTTRSRRITMQLPSTYEVSCL